MATHRGHEDFPARAALAVRRDPGLDAHAAAAAVASQPGADLAGGAGHCRASRLTARWNTTCRRWPNWSPCSTARCSSTCPSPPRDPARRRLRPRYYQVLGPRGELSQRRRTFRPPDEDNAGDLQPAKCACATTRCGAWTCAWPTSGCAWRCRATRWRWCRWPKPAKSAACWPPKSSRA
jgi:hypothetical protein